MESPRGRLLRENKEAIEELQKWAEEHPKALGSLFFKS